VFDAHNSELEKIQPMIKHEMENAFKLDVPLTELGMGKDLARSTLGSIQ
jgi:DNA polymerase-1